MLAIDEHSSLLCCVHTNVRLGYKMLAVDKQSSLLCRNVNYSKKIFITLMKAHDDFDSSGTYPTLPVPQTRSLISGLDGRYFRSQGSLGSSPNTSSSRSDTPRADDQQDYDSNV
jgi:hypothetical protein